MLFFFLLISGKISSQSCTAVIGSNISPINGCEVLTVQFNDLSTGLVQSRTWNFGDGSATTQTQNPVHSFSAGNIGDTTYIVTLNTQCIIGLPSIAYDTVNVYKKPTVNFSASQVSLCALIDSTCFINLSSSGAGVTYAWNFGDFTTSTKFQPCHIYSIGGNYTVQLTVTNSHGCSNITTNTNYISITAAPNIDFNSSSFLGCSPMPVTFTNITDTASNSISGWQWNFGDGTPIVNTYNPPVHTYTLPGTYYVTMGAISSNGCSNNTTKGTIVRTTPTSTFTATSPICVGDTSILTYTGSLSSSATHLWDFAGGNCSPGTGIVPQKIYWNTSDTMNVKMTVSDSGCSSTTTVPILVNQKPSVTLTVSPNDTICQGQSVTFTTSPATLANYYFYKNSISVQSSTSNTFVLPNASSGDSLYVVGKNSANCISLNSNLILMHVNPLPIITLGSNVLSACNGDSLIFTATPPGFNNYSFYQGYLSLQNSAGNIYYSTDWVDGNSIYAVASNNGCTDSSNILIPAISQPLPPPQVNCGTSTDTTIEFTWLPITGAVGYLVSVNGGLFVSPSSGNNGTTNLVTGFVPGDSASIRVIALGPAPCGNSDTSLIAKCYANDCSAITFDISPYQTICAEDSITLTLSNLNISPLNVSWNGGTSLPNKITFTVFPNSDSIVGVTVSNPLQPTCPAVNNFFDITLSPLPVATISVTPLTDSICYGTTLIYSASPAGYADYSFYNGLSLVQTSNNPDYEINTLANGNSIYVVPTNGGCTGHPSDSISIAVFQPLPTPQVNCGNTTTSSIQFSWNSIANATGYKVSVNGGALITPSSGNNGTTHLLTGLSSGDSATIVVTALGSAPCGNSLPSDIQTCYAVTCTAITFNFNPNQTICSGDSVTLSLSGFNIPNPFVSWNGGPSVSKDSTFTFMPLNDTIISVSVSDTSQTSCGSISNFFVISVNPIPNVTLGISQQDDTTCLGAVIEFAASPIGYTTYSFYRGYLLLQSSASNTYATDSWLSGDPVFVMTTNNGCAGDSSNSIAPIIYQPLPTPQVNCGTSTATTIQFTWLPVTGATGYLVSVNGGSFTTPSSGNMGTTELLTGQTLGNTATIVVIALGPAPCGNSEPSPIHTCYAESCSAITFTINPNQTVCSGNSITLSLSGYSIANPFVSWNGGDTLANNNSYSISPTTDTIIPVLVSNPAQPTCVPVTNYFIIHAKPSPTASLSIAPSNDTVCEGTSATITASPGGYSNYSFYNGSSLIQTSTNPNYITSGSPSNLAIRVVTSYLGCQSNSDTLSLITLPTPTAVISSVPGSGSICFGDTVIFTALPASNANYVFYNGATVLQDSSINTFIHANLSLGNGNNISVRPTNSFGCVGNLSNILNFNVLSPPTILLVCSDINLEICDGDSVTFTASPAGMASYQFFNGGTSIQNSAIDFYATAGLIASDTITVIGTDNNGCKSLVSDSISLTIKPRPSAFISASDTTLCIGSSTTLSKNQNPVVAGTTFSWSTGLTDPSILVSPTITTNYILYSSLNACSGTPDTITIIVDSNPPVVSAGSNQTICIGDSIALTGSGGLTYSWLPTIGLSGSTSATPHVSPTTTTTYTLQATNLYCSGSASVTIAIDLCLTDLTEPIPSCITPNGDGANDFFKIPDFDYFQNKSLTIYNRWGNIVFKETPYINDWGGKSLSGGELPDATYYYILDLGNGSKPHAGYIMIQR